VTYSVGLFVARLRRQGLGREIIRLVLDWAFTGLDAEPDTRAGFRRKIPALDSRVHYH
jgi:RimJ/RimL family protein N-acetyltransferase